MKMSDETLRGRTVFASDGTAVGDISLLFIDSETWQVESVRVRLHKDVADRIGAERTAFRAGHVEIPASMLQSAADAVLLSVGLDELRQTLPEPAETPEPEAAPAHEVHR
jgi:sporulation protein YlmC with PRC-barrel domain